MMRWGFLAVAIVTVVLLASAGGAQARHNLPTHRHNAPLAGTLSCTVDGSFGPLTLQVDAQNHVTIHINVSSGTPDGPVQWNMSLSNGVDVQSPTALFDANGTWTSTFILEAPLTLTVWGFDLTANNTSNVVSVKTT